MNFNKVFAVLALIVLAGVCNGIMDTLAFHYPTQSILPQDSRFWNPEISWQNKYAADAEGVLLKPLRPKFTGSTTIFAWATDGWHLFKTLFQALQRLAVVLLASWAFSLAWRPLYRRLFWAGIWIALTGVQAIGFHIVYSFIF